MIYVTSDIHGNIERYRSVIDQIKLRPDDTLYILGDVIDRFPGGIDLLLEIMDTPNIKMLLGNHEYMMLCALGEKKYLSGRLRYNDLNGYRQPWYWNGGSVTQRSFL